MRVIFESISLSLRQGRTACCSSLLRNSTSSLTIRILTSFFSSAGDCSDCHVTYGAVSCDHALYRYHVILHAAGAVSLGLRSGECTMLWR